MRIENVSICQALKPESMHMKYHDTTDTLEPGKRMLQLCDKEKCCLFGAKALAQTRLDDVAEDSLSRA